MTGAMPGMPAGGAHPRAAWDRVIEALTACTGAVRITRPDTTMARCPVHEDTRASLSVTWAPGDRGGLVLLNCFTCGARAPDVAPALGLSLADLFDEPLPPRDLPLQHRSSRSPQQRRSGQRRGRLGRLPVLLATQTHTEPVPAAHRRRPTRTAARRVSVVVVRARQARSVPDAPEPVPLAVPCDSC